MVVPLLGLLRLLALFGFIRRRNRSLLTTALVQTLQEVAATGEAGGWRSITPDDPAG